MIEAHCPECWIAENEDVEMKFDHITGEYTCPKCNYQHGEDLWDSLFDDDEVVTEDEIS